MLKRNGILISRKFNEYLVPTVFTSFAMSMASVVDSAIVGNLLGAEALAAIGIASPIIFILNTIYMLFGVGGISCASVAKGEMDEKKANQIFSITILLGVLVMSLFTILVQLFAHPIALFLSSGDVALSEMVAAYIRPLTFTGPLLMFSGGVALFARADGKPKSSAWIVVISNVVNLVFDYSLIKFFGFQIEGAGLSTSLGYLAGCFIVIPYMISKERTFRFSMVGMSVRCFVEVMKTGMPKALNQITSLLRTFILNSIILVTLGSIGMSMMTVFINVTMISNIFVTGTSDTLLPIVGTLFGEKDYYGVRTSVKCGARVLLIACSCLFVFFVCFPNLVGLWFGLADDTGAFAFALRLYALYLPFQATIVTLQNFYNTTGRSLIASVMATLDGLIYVIFYAFLCASIKGNLLWLCFCLSGVSCLLTVLVWGAVIRKKEQVKGILLLKETVSEGISMDVTIEAKSDQISDLLNEVVLMCEKGAVIEVVRNNIIETLEKVLTDMKEYTEYKKQATTVDVWIHISEDTIQLRLRDNGIRNNSIKNTAVESIENLEVGSNLEVKKQLGFTETLKQWNRV